jgi:uncharacterized protein
MSLNLFGFLMPKQEPFVGLFGDHGVKICEAAEALHRMVAAPGSIAAEVAIIRRLEGEADLVAKRIFIAANRAFNAPIDREDILGLTHDLDDVIDLIEDTAKAIERYAMHDFSAEMRAMVDRIQRCVSLIRDALALLDSLTRDAARIRGLCEQIGLIEGEADDYFDTGLTQLRAKLRSGEIDVSHYLDGKEVYEQLEAVVDKCDDVANEIETITIKHV